MQRFREILSRWERKELSAMEASEVLGCSECQFRRYRHRYEEGRLEGLMDRRFGGCGRQFREALPRAPATAA
jgi:hypothetical protein